MVVRCTQWFSVVTSVSQWFSEVVNDYQCFSMVSSSPEGEHALVLCNSQFYK